MPRLSETEINMLSFTIERQIRPVIDAIMDAGQMVDLYPPLGIADADDRTQLRPSTNEECAIGTAHLLVPNITFDVRKPIPNQVTNWLRTIAKELLEAAEQIDLIEDGRDLRAVKRLVRGK